MGVEGLTWAFQKPTVPSVLDWDSGFDLVQFAAQFCMLKLWKIAQQAQSDFF